MRILVFSDGTGNSSAKLFRTNVWRLYEALDLCDNAKQVAFYDNGVGTAGFKPLAILGGAFGLGLKRNVRDLYMFICRNYAKNPGPHQICAFGFSRGAFTIRVLLGLIKRQGLVPYNGDERELKRRATWAYRQYRAEALPSKGLVGALRWLRDRLLNLPNKLLGKTPYDKGDNDHHVGIAFVGLWDTVAAYGFPIIEMTRGWSRWVWPLDLPTRQLSAKVEKACHALALDDERQTFHPLLWDESNEDSVWRGAKSDGPPVGEIDNERVSQVWFSGMHSNVGGGYPDDGMAHESLVWIARQAQKRTGMQLKPDTLDDWTRRCTASAPMSDSRSGVGVYYRYLPRLVSTIVDDEIGKVFVELPKIHASVFKRIASRIDGYAPIVLPSRYAVTDGEQITDLAGAAQPTAPAIETAKRAVERGRCQDQVWDLVWYRRIAYFLTVGVTFLLVAVIPFVDWQVRDDWSFLWSPWLSVSAAIAWLRDMLPGFVSPLLDYYSKYPVQLVVGGAVVAGLVMLSSWLDRRNLDTMRRIWRGEDPPPRSILLKFSNAVRTSAWYSAALNGMRHTILPNVFGIVMLALVVFGVAVMATRLSHEVPMVVGLVCRGGNEADLKPIDAQGRFLDGFSVSQICQPMGVKLERGVKYEISVKPSPDNSALPPEPQWRDASRQVTSLRGFASDTWLFRAAFPLRRHRLLNWYVPVARVGKRGKDYFPLTTARTELVPQMGGELFMYVNDALAPYPSTFFYDNNCDEHNYDKTADACNGRNASQYKWFIRRVPTNQ
jgi:uncharacterized protein (DUF2235 family)